MKATEAIGRTVRFPTQMGVSQGRLVRVGECGHPPCRFGTDCCTVQFRTERAVHTVNFHRSDLRLVEEDQETDS
jgi:hypothetical protein